MHVDTKGNGSLAPTFALVVPLFNEKQRVKEFGPQLVDYMKGFPPGSELIFVDDGSSDGTSEVVRSLIEANRDAPVHLVVQNRLGKGAAVTAGIREAEAEIVGFCDVDLSTPLSDLNRIIWAASEGHALAIGSRDVAGSRLIRRQGLVREILGRTYNQLVQLTVIPGIHDSQCGAKVAPRKIWEAVLPHCREAGFAWDVEVIAVARALGFSVQEVPVRWRNDDRSRVRMVRDGLDMLRAIGRIRRSVERIRCQFPEKSRRSEVFDGENVERLMQADYQHWWFRSKASVVSWALRRWCGRLAEGWLVDLGAGSGGVTASLGWDPMRVVAVEGSEPLLRAGRERHGLVGVIGRVERVPLRTGSVDVVCLLDVIEHVAEPEWVLEEARRVLREEGRLVVTVPGHQWLWSGADELLGHARRYSRRSLVRELRAAGFEPVFVSHVFSWLVIPVWVVRRLARRREQQLGLGVSGAWIDRLALVLTVLERAIISRLQLPVGTSILAVAAPRPGRR